MTPVELERAVVVAGAGRAAGAIARCVPGHSEKFASAAKAASAAMGRTARKLELQVGEQVITKLLQPDWTSNPRHPDEPMRGTERRSLRLRELKAQVRRGNNPGRRRARAQGR